MPQPSAAHLLIRDSRLKLGLSQAFLARKAGIPQSHLARIESGKGDVQLGTLRKIFAAMSLDLLLVARRNKRAGLPAREMGPADLGAFGEVGK